MYWDVIFFAFILIGCHHIFLYLFNYIFNWILENLSHCFSLCWSFFNWRIIALHNFVVFCHTSRFSHRYTHVPSLPSPSPSHPSACHNTHVWVSRVIQLIPIGYLFYIWYCKFLCFSLHTSPLVPPLLLLCPWVCSLCLFLHCCPKNKLKPLFLKIYFLHWFFPSIFLAFHWYIC